MPRRCPWCLESLSPADRGASDCPHCERPIGGPLGEPSELDLRYEGIEARQQTRALEVLKWGAPTIAIVAVAASMAHLGGVLLAPLVAVVHMVLLRIYLVGEARRYLGPTRRLFTRWAARFAFLWLGLPGYAAMAAPLVGIVSGVATFVVLTGVIHVYTAWSLQRERRKAPLMLWEKALMTGLAVLTAAVIVALAVGGVLLGWSINALVERMASD